MRDWNLIGKVPKIKMLPGEHERDSVLTDKTVKEMVGWLRENYPKDHQFPPPRDRNFDSAR